MSRRRGVRAIACNQEIDTPFSWPRRSKDGDRARRLLAIRLVHEGPSWTEAARVTGMGRQTLQDCVIRYNAEGVEGLRDRAGPVRPAQLTAAQLAELNRLVEARPDIEVHGAVRWRCVDLQAEIKRRLDVEVSERDVWRLLKRDLYESWCHAHWREPAGISGVPKFAIFGPPLGLSLPHIHPRPY